MNESQVADNFSIGWLLAATVFFVLVNGFFVAAEFALVKVRPSRMEPLAAGGNLRARTVVAMTRHLDRYLSACQLGITLASLILGWLAEPAVAALLIDAASHFGLNVATSGWLHPTALALALAIVTLLHMTVGEQAPKMWAIHKAEGTAMNVAYPLKVFATSLKPLIWLVNITSNGMARLAGLSVVDHHAGTYEVEELRAILNASAKSGSITSKQRAFGDNVLGLADLEVRHIMVPRTEVAYLSADTDDAENMRIVRSSRHSRFPLGDPDLDNVRGLVHARDILGLLLDGKKPDITKLARKIPLVPDTQPLPQLIIDMARMQTHCAIVVDEHGTTVGIAFLEDAIEEIVGPIPDEFDEKQERIEWVSDGVVDMEGSVPLPEAARQLNVEFEEEADTVSGWLVATLGRLPRKGDTARIGDFRASVVSLRGRRIGQMRFERDPADGRDA